VTSPKRPEPIERPRDRAPALLCDATWYGTLAAARNLGARGIPVTLASDTRLAPARWSRHVTRTVSAPSSKQAARFLEWLERFGQDEPGHVLYPTSDEVAWLVAAHTETLSRWFRLYTPSLETLARLLDKKLLLADAQAAGLDVPDTRVASDETEVEAAGRELGFPLFVKPRAQVFGAKLGKGMRVDHASELLPAWRAVRRMHFDPVVAGRLPDLSRPLIQVCSKDPERVYTVDGFIDETGELYASMACVKVLQRPRGSGPGIVFVQADLDPALDQGLRQLFRATGYRGVFDAEFLEIGERKVLIDVNPRFYNHMAFEVDRGLQLPYLAYLAALGDRDALRRETRGLGAIQPNRRIYAHQLSVLLLLGVQTLSRAMSPDESKRWLRLIAQHSGAVTDPAKAVDDPRPAHGELAFELWSLLKHPRAFLRTLS
jgi:D-aspartate ligase